MLIDNCAIVTWNPKNKRRYVDLGYEFTKMGDTFLVKLEDLSDYSVGIVRYICDYCGKECTNIWQIYRVNKSIVNKDCCKECQQIKSKESIEEKYGGYSEMNSATSAQRQLTNIKRYGSANPFGSEIVKEKIAQTNLRKYGVEYTQQSCAVRSKTEQTCLERYGVANYVELFKGKYIKDNSPRWKGGAERSRVERASYEYVQWRKAVFSRDKYTCQKCFAKSGVDGKTVEIQAHHICNWSDNPDKRYDIDNGITLCESCHIQFHVIYGKHNNNEAQLEEFLNITDKKVC